MKCGHGSWKQIACRETHSAFISCCRCWWSARAADITLVRYDGCLIAPFEADAASCMKVPRYGIPRRYSLLPHLDDLHRRRPGSLFKDSTASFHRQKTLRPVRLSERWIRPSELVPYDTRADNRQVTGKVLPDGALSCS